MNNLDINENDDKLNLIKQIYKYEEKGYELNRHYSISDDINELKFQLAILHLWTFKTPTNLILINL